MNQDQIKTRRDFAERLRHLNQTTPTNTVDGVHSIVRAILARGADTSANKADEAGRAAFENQFQEVAPNMRGLVDIANSPYATSAHQDVISALMKGVPNYATGGHHKGGLAVVGENGPEVVNLPPSMITPVQERSPIQNYTQNLGILRDGFQEPLVMDDYLRSEMGDGLAQRYEGMTREQKLDFLNNPENGFVPPAPVDTRELLSGILAVPEQPQSRFQDDRAVRTADMSRIEPSGTGERNQLNGIARSYQTLMKGLQDYETLFNNGGATMLPGMRNDQLSTAHRNLQMQMKELYNLGVLNGPDLDLMNQILLDPTSVSGNLMGALGVADMDERINRNIQDVRRMMTDLATPSLQQLGLDPADLAPPPAEKPDLGNLSDEELLRQLMGS